MLCHYADFDTYRASRSTLNPMNRRLIFKALTGLFATKSLPVAPVKVPASLQVAKAAAATNPLFNDLGPEGVWTFDGVRIVWTPGNRHADAPFA